MQNIHSHVWDAKLHLGETTVREADISRGFPLDLTVDFDAFMRDIAPFRKVAVFGLKARLTGYWVPDEYVAAFVSRAPERLAGFASCDPSQPGCMEELTYAIERLGLKGLKMGPVYTGVDPRDGRCVPIYDYCQRKGIPILFHTGATFNRAAPLELGRPLIFDEVAIRFPSLKMVLAHMGHPFHEECVVVIRKHPNVYADVSALHYRPSQFHAALLAAQEYKVTHKLLFGTDYPFAGSADSIAGLRGVNDGADSHHVTISNDVIDEILERDAFKLLGVEL